MFAMSLVCFRLGTKGTEGTKGTKGTKGTIIIQ
jgi:hypothetical protein